MLRDGEEGDEASDVMVCLLSDCVCITSIGVWHLEKLRTAMVTIGSLEKEGVIGYCGRMDCKVIFTEVFYGAFFLCATR